MPFERFEVDTPQESMADLFDSILDELGNRGTTGANTEPEICIVLRSNIQGEDGLRLSTAIIYLGATPQEVATDLNTRQ